MADFPVGTVVWAEFLDGSGGERALMTERGLEGTRGAINRSAESAFKFRVLAVVDPEGADSDRLTDLIAVEEAGGAEGRVAVRAAVAQYAKPVVPKPPKPDEPRRLGATVRDSIGTVWIKVGRPSRLGTDRVWAPEGLIGPPDSWLPYSDIDVVEVVNESG